MSDSAARHYDVIILGSGIGGSILACILAKKGVSVLMVEELAHPRFTIGESLIPETGIRLRILAEKYGVPEIGWLGNFYQLRDNVSSNCGAKRAFSFMYHKEGSQHVPEQTNQLPTLTPPFGPDSHLFRQDTDAWLASVSTLYGAHFQQQVKVEGLRFEADRVVMKAAGGVEVSADFLIDAGGMRSHVSTLFNLRDTTPRFKTDTRTLYTHFIGLPAADCLLPEGGAGLPSPLGQGTMHHVFDGGWMWIIPFNNHPEATNPLTSVGVMLDRRKHPKADGPPGEEFQRLISRYPSIARHFARATPIRPWIGSGRLQYSSPRTIGPRFIQLPHAAAFVDPLYSSGMSVLTVAIDLIADALLPAIAERRYDEERFELVDTVVQKGFDHYDQVVSRSFDSFADYDLWNAWNRNWVLGNFLGTFGALSLLVNFLSTGDRSWLDRTTEPHRIGVLGSHLPEVVATMHANAEEVGAATRGERSPREASDRIFARLGALDFLPPYMGFGDRDQRSQAVFTLPAGVRHVLWYRYNAPRSWKEYADLPLLTFASETASFVGGAWGEGLRRSWSVFRDVFSAGNRDWRHNPAALRAHDLIEPPKAK
jgi:FADH2 O2-dependent halogenase